MSAENPTYPPSFYTENFVKSCSGLLCSYLWAGDLANIKSYMTMLGIILKVKPNLWHCMSDKEQDTIKQIGTALKAGFVPNPWGLSKIPELEETKEYKEIKMYFDTPKDAEENNNVKIETEKDLQNMLYYTYESMEYLTGDKSKLIVVPELNVKYGRIDIQARGEKICHVIEIKLKLADHKIVGQMMKYARSAGSKLHYGLYDEINLITVAEDYDNSTILDLKAIGTKIFKYRIKDDKIAFMPV